MLVSSFIVLLIYIHDYCAISVYLLKDTHLKNVLSRSFLVLRVVFLCRFLFFYNALNVLLYRGIIGMRIYIEGTR